MPRDPKSTAAILDRVIAGELKVTRAAEKLGLGAKQVSRLIQKYLANGLEGLASQRFGRPDTGYPPDFVERVIGIVGSKYEDFGPTLASEKLKERDGIDVSREWLRKVMIKAGFWRDRAAKKRRVFQLREPCERPGELVQIDGSHHRWFEGRGPKCALLVFIDDATSGLGHLEFAPSESAMAYMAATKKYLLKHGKPVAFYSDKHTIFRNPHSNLLRTEGRTQFMNVLQRLNIGLIYAETSEAKGRVERANRTLQDRLVKEMRLEGISTIDEGNVFIDDATSRLMYLFFVPVEDSRAYLEGWKHYVRAYGRPIRVYADGHAALFRTSGRRRERSEDEFSSDLARAFKTLHIGRERSICAEGRGRVERVHRTLKDHLPKYLRRHGATTMAEANALLPAFMEGHNRHYGREPKRDLDWHRDVSWPCDLDLVFSEQEPRRLSRSLTLSYRSKTFALRATKAAKKAAGREVVVHQLTDGGISITHNDTILPHWVVDEFNEPSKKIDRDGLTRPSRASIH